MNSCVKGWQAVMKPAGKFRTLFIAKHRVPEAQPTVLCVSSDISKCHVYKQQFTSNNTYNEASFVNISLCVS